MWSVYAGGAGVRDGERGCGLYLGPHRPLGSHGLPRDGAVRRLHRLRASTQPKGNTQHKLLNKEKKIFLGSPNFENIIETDVWFLIVCSCRFPRCC